MAQTGYSRQYFLLIPSFIIVLGPHHASRRPGGTRARFVRPLSVPGDLQLGVLECKLLLLAWDTSGSLLLRASHIGDTGCWA